jgi:hypothetical protein
MTAERLCRSLPLSQSEGPYAGTNPYSRPSMLCINGLAISAAVQPFRLCIKFVWAGCVGKYILLSWESVVPPEAFRRGRRNPGPNGDRLVNTFHRASWSRSSHRRRGAGGRQHQRSGRGHYLDSLRRKSEPGVKRQPWRGLQRHGDRNRRPPILTLLMWGWLGRGLASPLSCRIRA